MSSSDEEIDVESIRNETDDKKVGKVITEPLLTIDQIDPGDEIWLMTVPSHVRILHVFFIRNLFVRDIFKENFVCVNTTKKLSN